jgi:hypothetical protein
VNEAGGQILLMKDVPIDCSKITKVFLREGPASNFMMHVVVALATGGIVVHSLEGNHYDDTARYIK